MSFLQNLIKELESPQEKRENLFVVSERKDSRVEHLRWVAWVQDENGLEWPHTIAHGPTREDAEKATRRLYNHFSGLEEFNKERKKTPL